MKAFALAVVATAGLLCSAGTADAQWRSRGSYARTYSYPSYGYSYPTTGYSTSSYSTYSSYPTFGAVTPTYSDTGVVVTSGYTPTFGAVTPTYYDSGVVTSGYAPAYSPTVYPSGYSYPSSGFGGYSSYPTYGSYNSSSYYGSGYNGMYVSPSGVNVGGRRIMRW